MDAFILKVKGAPLVKDIFRPLEVRKKSEASARKYVEVQREQFQRLGLLGD
jgi:isoleucyl-tRNA synthetase